LKEELCRTSPRVINSKLQSGRRERTSTGCGSGEVGRAKNVHALQSKADDGFFKGVSVVADVVGRVGADSDREVEHLARVVTVGGFGGFVMVENTGSFEVARDGAVVMAIMDGDGLFDEVAERGWGEARGGSRGRDTRDSDLGHEGVVERVVKDSGVDEWERRGGTSTSGGSTVGVSRGRQTKGRHTWRGSGAGGRGGRHGGRKCGRKGKVGQCRRRSVQKPEK
jgi:hypothetical protein